MFEEKENQTENQKRRRILIHHINIVLYSFIDYILVYSVQRVEIRII